MAFNPSVNSALLPEAQVLLESSFGLGLAPFFRPCSRQDGVQLGFKRLFQGRTGPGCHYQP
jgi:hypothetical protein